MDWLYQKTLLNQVTFNGIGLHTGKDVEMTVYPASVNSGISFVINGVKTPANISHLHNTQYCTSLKHHGQEVKTIEHFMSAVIALGLDNLEIRINSPEVPLLDGSSADFYWGLSSAGVCEQKPNKKVFAAITKKVEVQVGASVASIEPFESPFVSVALEYNEPVVLKGGLTMDYDLFKGDYAVEISRARTYGFEKHQEFYNQNNLARGATVDNCLVMNDNHPLSPGGLRYNNEIVRHKILDVFGDLALLGAPFLGKYKCYQPGHTVNLALVKKIIELDAVENVTLKGMDSHQKEYIEVGMKAC